MPAGLRPVITFHDDQVALRCVVADPLGLAVLRRLVAGKRRFIAGKFDDDMTLAQDALSDRIAAGADKETASKAGKSHRIGRDVVLVGIRVGHADMHDPIPLDHGISPFLTVISERGFDFRDDGFSRPCRRIGGRNRPPDDQIIRSIGDRFAGRKSAFLIARIGAGRPDTRRHQKQIRAGGSAHHCRFARRADQTIHAGLRCIGGAACHQAGNVAPVAGGGKIINVSAPSALHGSVGVADYAAAKGGIISFTRNAAEELKPHNIQVNCISPVADTRMIDDLLAFRRRHMGDEAAASSLAGIVPPETVAPAFVFFACGDSDRITGQILEFNRN